MTMQSRRLTTLSQGSHPLLEQVPLTVSPFVTLPTATTLSYNYKAMPSTLPPSSTGITTAVGDDSTGSGSSKPKYVISPSGHAAHPDDIIASCRALQSHITKMQDDADRELRELEERISARELAEKRRVAPGWLDSDARLLEPEKTANPTGAEGDVPGMPAMTEKFHGMGIRGSGQMETDQGAELDRVFGSINRK